jgi:hypothetical protein
LKIAVDNLSYENCVADQLEEGLIPTMEVIHKQDGSLIIVEKMNEGKFKCHPKGEPEATKVSSSKIYSRDEISQYLNFTLLIFADKIDPI